MIYNEEEENLPPVNPLKMATLDPLILCAKAKMCLKQPTLRALFLSNLPSIDILVNSARRSANYAIIQCLVSKQDAPSYREIGWIKGLARNIALFIFILLSGNLLTVLQHITWRHV